LLRLGLDVQTRPPVAPYRFSVHRVIFGKSKNDWQNVDYVLKYFVQRRTDARNRYLDHVRQGIKMEKRPGRDLNESMN